MKSQILRKSAEEAAIALESKRVLETLDEARISNLVVLDWGTYPSVKSGPDRKKILITGVLAGVVAGIGLAFVRSSLDRRVHVAADLERAAGAPAIASIRRGRAPRGVRR
jgi:capsular polysaccharide biosynthesis protein